MGGKNRPDTSGMTALQIAVKNCNKEIVSLLIKHRANVLATNSLGTHAQTGKRAGRQEILMLLLNAMDHSDNN